MYFETNSAKGTDDQHTNINVTGINGVNNDDNKNLDIKRDNSEYLISLKRFCTPVIIITISK